MCEDKLFAGGAALLWLFGLGLNVLNFHILRLSLFHETQLAAEAKSPVSNKKKMTKEN